MELLLLAGDTVFTIGIIIIALIIGLKLITVVLKKEFELFKFLVKLGLWILLGGGVLLFIGRLF